MPLSETGIAAKLIRQSELNYTHIIPDIVIELARNLRNVTYRETLSKFAEAYFPQEFKRLRDQFEIVLDYESELVRNCLGEDVGIELDSAMRDDLSATAINETYRYHFIHAFQDFLTGVIVIDKFYDDFARWFSGESTDSTRIESAWLLAALFHDHFKVPPPGTSQFVVQERQLPPELLEEEYRLASATELASLYEHLRCGGSLRSWSRTQIQDHPLVEILLTQLKNKNHGAVGGLSLLTHKIPDLHIIYSAALAVALHDRVPREELLTRNIFPVQMEKFPLIALLLYCDAIQEWNRCLNSKVDLVGITFLPNEVSFVLHFSIISVKGACQVKA